MERKLSKNGGFDAHSYNLLLRFSFNIFLEYLELGLGEAQTAGETPPTARIQGEFLQTFVWRFQRDKQDHQRSHVQTYEFLK